MATKTTRKRVAPKTNGHSTNGGGKARRPPDRRGLLVRQGLARQGLGAGLLTARLGLRAMRTTRPIAFESGEQPRLADLRREVWQQLRRLDDTAGKG